MSHCKDSKDTNCSVKLVTNSELNASTIYIKGCICQQIFTDMTLLFDDDIEIIYLFITSSSGDMHYAYSIVDLLKFYRSTGQIKELRTVIIGYAYSAAGAIWLCGDKRYYSGQSVI
jgi:ATP-dependent protease ClpP protease subunit